MKVKFQQEGIPDSDPFGYDITYFKTFGNNPDIAIGYYLNDLTDLHTLAVQIKMKVSNAFCIVMLDIPTNNIIVFYQ